MSRVRVNDPGKLTVLIVAIVCATVLLGLSSIDEAAGVGLITYALGYLTGNGRLASTGRRSEPTIGTADEDDESSP